ncbi:MAG: 50S ribosomal protein L10, partial [bacterium]
FSEEHENLKIKGGLLNGGLIDPDQVEAVSELPSRRELLTSLAGVLQKPIQSLAHSLQYPIQELVQSLEQIKDEKESSS